MNPCFLSLRPHRSALDLFRLSPHRSALRPPSGFSLLEMLLALAILGTAMGLLAQVAATGTDAAREGRDLSQARLIAQSQLAQVLIQANNGVSPQAVPPTAAEGVDSQGLAQFQYQIDVAPASIDGMLAVRVGVQAIDPEGGPTTVSYSITRWLVDPLLGLEQRAAEEKAMSEEEG